MQSVFFGTYTAIVKMYCDKQFLSQVVAQLPNELLAGKLIVENSKGENPDSDRYCGHLQALNEHLGSGAEIVHLDVEREPKEGRLHRRIVQSANYIRVHFLNTTADWLLFVEADVIPPIGFLPKMLERAQGFDIFGLPYYIGWHSPEWFKPYHDLVMKDMVHVLSGCTLYSRRLMERFPFRYDINQMAALPDYWISFDAIHNGFSLGTWTGLKCQHLSDEQGHRGWENL